jgi:predicted transcriptional regulator
MECAKKCNPQKFSCEICNCNLKTLKSFNKHLDSKKHKKNFENLNICDKKNYTYTCDECEFYTNYKQHYNKHIKSRKHQQILNPSSFVCDCGKMYKYERSLQRHKKKCDFDKTPQMNNMNSTDIIDIIKTVLETNSSNLTTIINQNTELTSQNTELTKQMHEQFNSVVELAKEPKTVNTYNDKVSITTYLNTQCKDAKNLDDLLRTAKYSFEEIEEMYEIGWLKSTINKLRELFDDLDQTLRPIHCTDAKRKQFYVKMKDEWEKIIGPRLLEIVVFIIQKIQTATLMDWKKKNSEKMDKDDYLHNKSMAIIQEITKIATDDYGDSIKTKLQQFFTTLPIDRKKFIVS